MKASRYRSPGNVFRSILLKAGIIHKRKASTKHYSGAIQGIGCIINGLEYTHSSSKISIPSCGSHCRLFPANIAVKRITSPSTVPMQRRWDCEIQINNKRSGLMRGAFYFQDQLNVLIAAGESTNPILTDADFDINRLNGVGPDDDLIAPDSKGLRQIPQGIQLWGIQDQYSLFRPSGGDTIIRHLHTLCR